jgi:hypothetical protein
MILIGADVTWQRDEETGEWKIIPAEKKPQPKERRTVLAPAPNFTGKDLRLRRLCHAPFESSSRYSLAFSSRTKPLLLETAITKNV